MIYFINRFKCAICKFRLLLFLAFLPAILYPVFISLLPGLYVISQEIYIGRFAPISISESPVGVIYLNDLILSPDRMFLDTFSLLELQKTLSVSTRIHDESSASTYLRNLIKGSMGLVQTDENTVVITYRGKNLSLGKELVAFFSKSLIERGEEGLDRKMNGSDVARPVMNHSNSGLPANIPKLAGSLRVDPQRVLWSDDRLTPTILILLGSLAASFLFIFVVEWSDPSFKTERQVARYLGGHILGSIPNVDKIVEKVGSGDIATD